MSSCNYDYFFLGKVYTLGRKEYGRLGMGNDAKELKKPTMVPALKDKVCTSVGCGSSVSFAVTDEGTRIASMHMRFACIKFLLKYTNVCNM